MGLKVLCRRGLVLVLAVAAGCSWGTANAERNQDGIIVAPGEISVDRLEVGDCFGPVDDGNSTTKRLAVPCSEPHQFELYHQFELEGSEFPGEGITKLSQQGCLSEFEDFIGQSYAQSSLDISAIFPSPKTWAKGDRVVLCSVTHLRQIDGDVPLLSGTARYSKL